MADFSVDMGDAGASYERGVATPSYKLYDSGAANAVALGKGLFEVLDSYAESKQTSQAGIDRQLNGEWAKGVNDLKGKSPEAVKAGMTALITRLGPSGFEVDGNAAQYAKSVLGVDLDYLNVNPRMAMQNKVNEILAENPAYETLALNNLQKAGVTNPTGEDVQKEIFEIISSVEAAALMSATTKTMSEAKWNQYGSVMAEKAISDLKDLGVTALGIEIEGGNVNPKTLQQLKASSIALKAQFAKPAYVSEEAYQGVKLQLEAIDNLITSIENYDTEVVANFKKGMINNIDMAIMKQIEAEGISNPLMARALLANMDKIAEQLAAKDFGQMMTLMSGVKVEDLNYKTLEIFDTGGTEQTGIIGPIPLDSNNANHHPDEVDKALERTSGERLSLIEFGLSFNVLALEPEAMNQENARNLVLAGIDSVALNIATSPELVDDKFMFGENGLFGTKTMELLNKIDTLDPERAGVARRQLVNAAQAQFDKYQTALSGSLQDSYFNITGLGKVTYDLDRRTMEGQFRMGAKARDLVNGYASRYYNGDVTAMIADRGRRLETFDRSQLDMEGFKIDNAFREYREIQKQANISKNYIQALKTLGFDTSQIEQTSIREVQAAGQEANLGSFKNPYRIQWSNDQETNEKLYASLGVGEYYIAADGDIEQKVR